MAPNSITLRDGYTGATLPATRLPGTTTKVGTTRQRCIVQLANGHTCYAYRKPPAQVRRTARNLWVLGPCVGCCSG